MTAATRAPRTTGDGTVHFGLVELDLLATHAGVAMPFPLRVPSFGRIPGEREVLLGTAGQTLRARGLADDSGPLGPAAELVAALHQHRSTVDLVLTGPEGTIAVVAVVYRSTAMICHQPLTGDPANTVAVRRVPDNELTRELLAFVPDVAPARSMPITLPARAVNGARDVLDGVSADREKERRLRELVRECGGDPGMLDQLAGLLPEVRGRGQLGVTRRARAGDLREGAELSWLDGPRGRVRVSFASEHWMSVNPLRQNDLRSSLEELATMARAHR
ncbi:ESX secretion-associated protein EspG [Saccharopolyspora taberi]|uniref:EspG family protein n=1 Tax=Saccharopolyspora taberi TaxID=60895 RepID=A0ABN3VA25_9PSEU